MAFLSFRKPRPEDAARKQVEAWARASGAFGPEVVIKVNEIVCPDPACPGFETVVLTLRPGRKSEALKIAKPVAEVTQVDVNSLFAPGPD